VTNVVVDIQTAAQWIAKALSSSGYVADFSPASLWEIDRFFDEHALDGAPVRGGLLASDLGSRLFAIGGYVGEVIRRSVGGEWRGNDADPQAEINVELVVADTTCWPVQRVMKRLKNGAEEGIAVYGGSFGLAIGPRPTRIAKGRPWWKMW
jgi:hypothetical protein